MITRTPTPPINGAAVLGRLHDALTRYVILPSPEAVIAVTLWIAATHAQTAWAHAARLVIRSPEKRCGKSRLLDLVEGTCHDPLITVNASPAAVYRSPWIYPLVASSLATAAKPLQAVEKMA